jgi:organic hydroperoxide reductase OsmC/OhrA
MAVKDEGDLRARENLRRIEYHNYRRRISHDQESLVAKVPGAGLAKFMEIANRAKAGCPVSKLLKAKITMEAKLQP